MAWSNSKIFRSFLKDVLGNTTAIDLDSGADAPKVALYNNSITPDQDVASASSAYNAGVWNAGGVFDVTGWLLRLLTKGSASCTLVDPTA